jgi:hypothetical protein
MSDIPLCVDLDGSLATQDLFFKAYVDLRKKDFLANALL